MVFANVKFLRDLDWTKVHLKTVLHADRTVFHAIREDAQYALRDFWSVPKVTAISSRQGIPPAMQAAKVAFQAKKTAALLVTTLIIASAQTIAVASALQHIQTITILYKTQL